MQLNTMILVRWLLFSLREWTLTNGNHWLAEETHWETILPTTTNPLYSNVCITGPTTPGSSANTIPRENLKSSCSGCPPAGPASPRASPRRAGTSTNDHQRHPNTKTSHTKLMSTILWLYLSHHLHRHQDINRRYMFLMKTKYHYLTLLLKLQIHQRLCRRNPPRQCRKVPLHYTPYRSQTWYTSLQP